jgi:hypothetical protein
MTLKFHYEVMKTLRMEKSVSCEIAKKVSQKVSVSVYSLYLGLLFSQVRGKYASWRFLSKELKRNRRTLIAKCQRIVRRRVAADAVAQIQKFYLREDNSRMSAGKKETKTRRGQKMQVRYLTSSIGELYLKFLSEISASSPSVKRSLFYKHRPFYVVQPRLNNRALCCCIICSNTQVGYSNFSVSNATPDLFIFSSS